MTKKVKKRFVIWKWKKTGVFDSWDDCKKLVQWFTNAEYKSFLSEELAKKAFAWKYEDYAGKDNRELQSEFDGTGFSSKKKTDWKWSQDCIFVDAACSNNPWILERRGVDVDWKEIFRQWPYQDWTVNIWEFIALVQWLWYLKKIWKNKTIIYSDSMTAMSWVKNKKVKTTLKKNTKNDVLFDVLDRAVKYLDENIFDNPILKRNTANRGEIPADFGRK